MARGVGEEEGLKNKVESLDMHKVENSIFGFREFSGKSEFPTRRVSSDAEGDKVEVAKLASFGSKSNRTDDFWTRESWNLRLLDARVVELTIFGCESCGIDDFWVRES